ncbi:hypothetical protein EYS14_01960 [Alteromonadaceae bacterium M269]|nr:hypothetical protein EYS14_01960 [Alteromonadaceae bacterium M269]
MNKSKWSLKFLMVACLMYLGQGCSATSNETNPVATKFKHPMLLVIDDPRTERKKFGAAAGPGYVANIDYAEDPVLKRATNQLVKEYKLQAAEQWPLKSLGVHCIVIESPSSEVLTRLANDKRVKWVQPFNEFGTQFSQQSAVPDITVISPSITLPNNGHGVDIIVIDTGADTSHPAFNNSSMRYQNFVIGNGNGKNEVHGTAISGLLAANDTSNEIPVKGLTSGADLQHYRGCWQRSDGKGRCTTLTLALALDAAVETNPNILNLSLSGPKDKVLEALIDKLISQGTIIVSAHDAKRAPSDRFPQPQPGVIYAYGTSNEKPTNIPRDTFLASSTAVSLSPQGAYDVFSGHSIATPQLTAITASLLSSDPTISKNTIANRLKEWLTYMEIN